MQPNIREILTSFLVQSSTKDLSSTHYPTSYDDLELDVGFGFGVPAKISWIAFLGPEQTPQEGIFPALYFFKEHHKLILAYGISETRRPKKSWLAPLGIKTIEQYFKGLGVTPHKYGLSYVYVAYSTYKELDYEKIESDINALIAHYKKLFQ
jgi:5-methylcytosine-specific restriction enzyme B